MLDSSAVVRQPTIFSSSLGSNTTTYQDHNQPHGCLHPWKCGLLQRSQGKWSRMEYTCNHPALSSLSTTGTSLYSISQLPVWAHAIRSRPPSTMGRANFCTGVGLLYLLRIMLLLMIWPSLQSSNCNSKGVLHSASQNSVLNSHLHKTVSLNISHSLPVNIFSIWRRKYTLKKN